MRAAQSQRPVAIIKQLSVTLHLRKEIENPMSPFDGDMMVIETSAAQLRKGNRLSKLLWSRKRFSDQ